MPASPNVRAAASARGLTQARGLRIGGVAAAAPGGAAGGLSSGGTDWRQAYTL